MVNRRKKRKELSEENKEAAKKKNRKREKDWENYPPAECTLTFRKEKSLSP